MTTHHRLRSRPRGVCRLVTAVLVPVVALAACGGDGTERQLGAPVGEPVLPNLVPKAPTVIHMQRDDATGAWSMRFTSVLVNIGPGDFELHAVRTPNGWSVEQLLAYSDSGVERRPTDAVLVWGGDGHDHYHVERIATYRLEPIDADGDPVGGVSLTDAKIGFCFFDHSRELESGRDQAAYEIAGCGAEGATSVDMGLSPGWGDTYKFTLPGQEIDIDDLPDGRYRLWAEADTRGWFAETTRDDNRTWADIELATSGDLRTALVVAAGPEPIDRVP